MSTDPDPDAGHAADGRPVTEPDDLVLPEGVESTVTAGTPADTLDDASDEGSEKASEQASADGERPAG